MYRLQVIVYQKLQKSLLQADIPDDNHLPKILVMMKSKYRTGSRYSCQKRKSQVDDIKPQEDIKTIELYHTKDSEFNTHLCHILRGSTISRTIRR